MRADWSSADARWTVTVEHTDSGARSTRTCGFLYLCSGYYRYDEGYTPDWPGRQDFAGPSCTRSTGRTISTSPASGSS